jgi:rod shape determining protein RodA
MFDRRLIIHFDWLLLILTLLACFEGVVVIYSSTYKMGGQFYIKQIYWILIGLGCMLVVISIDYRTWGRYAYVLYAINMFLLIILLGRGAGNLKVDRWLRLGGFNIQPSEFMKITLILVLAHYFQQTKDRPLTIRDIIIPSILLIVPLGLIVKQPDLGTAITLVPIFLTILFIAGLGIRHILFIILSGVSLSPFIWTHIKEYQRNRILIFLNPNADPLGAGYHLIQSKIAVGSGGLWGKGFLMGTQNKLNFLPAQHTDFIFSVLSEEWGFLGALLTLVLIFLILIKGIDIAFHSKDRMGHVLTMGVVATLTFHVFINVGMVTGMMPITGLPLPFLSYGGSSIFSTLIGIGFLLNVRMRRFA